jgi:hypothetical protein
MAPVGGYHKVRVKHPFPHRPSAGVAFLSMACGTTAEPVPDAGDTTTVER